jgi:uncharacterized protein YjbI with pentapeptide repeats
MWEAHDAFGALLRRRCMLAVFGAAAMLLGAGGALAQGPYDDPKTAEGWAWPQIERAEMADFNERCGTPALDPGDKNDARWSDDCRKLSARFLQDLLTRAPWRESIPFAGIQIKGARIVGDLDLENAKLIRSISIFSSRIEGAVNLVRARTDSLIWLEGSLMNGRFDAGGLQSQNDLFLVGGSVFKNEVNLNAAKIDGSVDLTGARFEGLLGANQAHIGGYLSINSDEQNKASFNDVDLTDAKVGGQLNMAGASFNGVLGASLLRVGGNLLASSVGPDQTRFQKVLLLNAEIAGVITLEGVNFGDDLEAGSLRVGGTLSMASTPQHKASFKKVDLTGVKVTGNVVMGGASFDGALEAGLLQVGGMLGMASMAPNKSSFKSVNLSGAKVTGDVSMTGASFDGALNASSLEVGGDLSMSSDADNRTSFKDVNLNNAKIKGQLNMSDVMPEHAANFGDVTLIGAKVAGNISMIGAGFDGTLTAGLMQVDGHLFMGSFAEHKTRFKMVFLTSTRVAGDVYMSGASFDGALNAVSMQVGGDLLMNETYSADKVVMRLVHVGRDLDLRGANLVDLDLSGASITGALQFGSAQQGTPGKFGTLNLRSAHAGNLVAAKEAAWPQKGQLRLAGFTFSHLGGDRAAETRKQETGFWDNWVRLDPDYSPTPYAQLATAFTNSGDRDAADDIRYLGRERQREAACKNGVRGSCVLQTILGSVAGYGIGSHTFVVLRWVLVFWLAGVAVLWWTVPAAKHNGAIWCGCASLAQLLPVIRINKELTDFFDDPGRTRLKGWQVFVFSALGLVGFLLGTILLVAVSGLTHSS